MCDWFVWKLVNMWSWIIIISLFYFYSKLKPFAMLKNRIVAIFFYIAFTSICYSQSKTNLKEINYAQKYQTSINTEYPSGLSNIAIECLSILCLFRLARENQPKYWNWKKWSTASTVSNGTENILCSIKTYGIYWRILPTSFIKYLSISGQTFDAYKNHDIVKKDDDSFKTCLMIFKFLRVVQCFKQFSSVFVGKSWAEVIYFQYHRDYRINFCLKTKILGMCL